MYGYNASYSLTTALATTPEIDYDGAEWATVYVPSGSSITTLTFLGAMESGGTFLPLYNGGTAVTLTVVAGRAYALPTQCQGCRVLKITANAAGTVELSMKG